MYEYFSDIDGVEEYDIYDSEEEDRRILTEAKERAEFLKDWEKSMLEESWYNTNIY